MLCDLLTVLTIILSQKKYTYLLIMELRFDAILYLTWVLKMLMRTITNVYAGRIWHAGRRFFTPGVELFDYCVIESL